MKRCGNCINGPKFNKGCGDCLNLSNWQPIEPKRSKYHREIKPGIWIDVYDVLVAFNVTNPADAHAIKKLLMPGQRGHKDAIKDRREAIQSIERAIELEGDRNE